MQFACWSARFMNHLEASPEVSRSRGASPQCYRAASIPAASREGLCRPRHSPQQAAGNVLAFHRSSDNIPPAGPRNRAQSELRRQRECVPDRRLRAGRHADGRISAATSGALAGFYVEYPPGPHFRFGRKTVKLVASDKHCHNTHGHDRPIHHQLESQVQLGDD